jgi:uncharacterized membrane protein
MIPDAPDGRFPPGDPMARHGRNTGKSNVSVAMSYFVAYLTVLIVFGVVDAGWLTALGPLLYRPALGDILLPSLRAGPAIAFYLVYPVGVVVFAVLPGQRATSLPATIVLALLFGALAYGTYDLTNYATMRHWTLQLTFLDIGYGAIASGLAATVAYLVVCAIFAPG